MLVFVGSTVLFVLLSSQWTEVSLKVVWREVDSAVHKSKVLKGDCVINENCNVWVITHHSLEATAMFCTVGSQSCKNIIVSSNGSDEWLWEIL